MLSAMKIARGAQPCALLFAIVYTGVLLAIAFSASAFGDLPNA
jgi:hypothetical protein